MLAPAHLALMGIILIWDIVLAGRIAQNDEAERPLQLMCGFAALMIVPALVLYLATSTVLTNRAVSTMDWLWPAVLILYAAQSVYALVRGLVPGELIRESATPHVAGFGVPRFLFALGLPIATYNVLIAGIGIVRYMVAHGHTSAQPFVALLAAQSLAMVLAGGSASVLASPLYLNVPIISPAFPALYKFTAPFRAIVSVYALAWVVAIIFIGLPPAVKQLQTYAAHARDPLRERPNGDFAIGLKVFPDLSGGPPAAAIRADSALADTIEVDAVEVVVRPGISRGSLDSLARVLDPWRRDSTTIIVAIGYPRVLVPEVETKPLDEGERLLTVRRVVARLHPDILLPAEDPYGAGAEAVGPLQPARWESYLIDAVRAAKAVDPKVRIGVSASDYRHGDSALYRVGCSRAVTDRHRRLLLLSVAVRRRRHPDGHAHRRPLDARDADDEGHVDLRDRRISARVRRAQPGRRDLAGARVGHRPSRRQGHRRLRGERLPAIARTARAGRTLPARYRDGHAGAVGFERVGEMRVDGWTGGRVDGKN